jgi:hypothetical protein
MEVKMDRLIAAVKMLTMCVCISVRIVVYMLVIVMIWLG